MYASADRWPSPAGMSILVSHSNALISAGLVATVQRIRGCNVQSSANEDRDKDSFDDVDLLIADSASLVRSAKSRAEAGPMLSPTRPRIVLLTATTEEGSTKPLLPDGVSACLPLDCGQEDLLKTVCGLIGSAVPGFQALKAVGRPRGGIAPSALLRVREHIERNLAEHIDIDHLATMAGLSACHFSRAFKQSMGTPPHRYMLSRRVHAAANLIKSTDRPMSDIALEVGFSDQSHFTRVFTAHIGQSPRRFRHQHR